LRYVDDMVLLAPDREVLVRWCRAIEEFLRDRLTLKLRPELKTPFAAGKGIDFVGWKTWWNRRLVRRRTLGNLRTRLISFERLAVRPACKGTARRIDLERNKAKGAILEPGASCQPRLSYLFPNGPVY